MPWTSIFVVEMVMLLLLLLLIEFFESAWTLTFAEKLLESLHLGSKLALHTTHHRHSKGPFLNGPLLFRQLRGSTNKAAGLASWLGLDVVHDGNASIHVEGGHAACTVQTQLYHYPNY
ncbi:hypothetical protein BCR41DRAFT_387133 [Lobosporangium transversale]|uniref:Uncharacterized protein n=1 Tax=Lobosporangium transversale TaxID=64571 RepID=A0A1Y2GL26_9FUNG|nr:hypothetical protein BCR41DRAFT_387133 [Lobosporangium transversale]ORZ13922.1 hypothetical protein BCR41DRAFT_387133 [Lobosporangium transversale]|eukprot:XP_021880706.1 hypothetical protein BCR41DRAFT_387133 [Lobosporangium transversale]